MNKWFAAGLGLLLAVRAGAGEGLSPEREAEVRAAMARGAAWLAAQQQPAGHWPPEETPAITALALMGLHATDPEAYRPAIDRAVVFLLTSVQEDGSIWRSPSIQRKGGGLKNYNTAICMTALHALRRPELVPIVQKARRFLAQAQHLESDIYRGGMGYDASTDRAYADLSNSYMAYEAMRKTQEVEDLRSAGEEKADLDWEAARVFLAQIQNLPGVNTNAWLSDDDDNRGGFAYSPGAGASVTNADGRITLRSYGSMTYAGLLSLIYAEVNAKDPRVQSAFDWARRHWTLEENPGLGPEGLYYFYNVLAKCLDTVGEESLTLPDGRTVEWREELARKLIALQRPDGSWYNENNRWWEADPNLVTSYTLIALATLLD